jgi:hypothetical protein
LVHFLLARIAEDEVRAGECQQWLECEPGVGCPAHGDPSRVVAECEAKRRIVGVSRAAPWPVLPLLALPYVDHPDYDEAWRL